MHMHSRNAPSHTGRGLYFGVILGMAHFAITIWPGHGHMGIAVGSAALDNTISYAYIGISKSVGRTVLEILQSHMNYRHMDRDTLTTDTRTEIH